MMMHILWIISSFAAIRNVESWGLTDTIENLIECQGNYSLITDKCLYFNGNESLSYDDANATCALTDGRLAIITDPPGILEHMKKYYSVGHFWFGGSDAETEGTWRWSTGKVIPSYQNWRRSPWHDGEPNGGVDENCILSNYEGYNAYNYTAEFGFVCETVLPKIILKDKNILRHSGIGPEGAGPQNLLHGNGYWNPEIESGYVIFDLINCFTVGSFELSNFGGDGNHDVSEFTLEAANDTTWIEDYQIILNETSVEQGNESQRFTFELISARYWRLTIISTHSGLHPCVNEIALFGNPANWCWPIWWRNAAAAGCLSLAGFMCLMAVLCHLCHMCAKANSKSKNKTKRRDSNANNNEMESEPPGSEHPDSEHDSEHRDHSE